MLSWELKHGRASNLPSQVTDRCLRDNAVVGSTPALMAFLVMNGRRSVLDLGGGGFERDGIAHYVGM